MTNDGTATDGVKERRDRFFTEAREARELGAARFRSGSREIDWKQPPPPPAVGTKTARVLDELDYAQREQVVTAWLSDRGLDYESLDRLIQREMELLSA